tara:strand:+ start:51432 stop:52319 length:888 start_codon:yes stop_codon:yes gene_type:complete
VKILILGLLSAWALNAQAELKVVTTTTTLENLVQEIGQDKVDVSSLTKSNQDPHFVEAKPSYMVKLRQADLLVSVGLDLEVGWIGNVQRGAKNPTLLKGSKGFFAAGDHIEAIDIPEGKLDRAEGDVHPLGNPHFHLDPIKTISVVEALAIKLGELDSANAEFYQRRAADYAKTLKEKMKDWESRITKSQVNNVITYHKSLSYFLRRFDLDVVASIEPKPGIPPTAKHIISLIKLVKQKNVKCILNENYFETTAGERIKGVTQASLQIVPVEVQTDYFDLIESLVTAVENCGKGV